MTPWLVYGVVWLALFAPAQTAAKLEDAMFDRYSQRAAQVLFLARLEAGQRGAKTISVDDLVASIIVEDQGKFAAVSDLENSRTASPGAPQAVYPYHQPFLDSQIATGLLQKIEGSLDRTASIPRNADMPISSDLEHTLKTAIELADSLHQAQVHPLHLLAAALEVESSQAVQLVKDAGITQEQVLEAIRKEP